MKRHQFLIVYISVRLNEKLTLRNNNGATISVWFQLLVWFSSDFQFWGCQYQLTKYQMTAHGLLPFFIIWPLASFPSTPPTFTDHGLGKGRINMINKTGQNSEHHRENLEKNKIDFII